jgi:hypothetical protein
MKGDVMMKIGVKMPGVGTEILGATLRFSSGKAVELTPEEYKEFQLRIELMKANWRLKRGT